MLLGKFETRNMPELRTMADEDMHEDLGSNGTTSRASTNPSPLMELEISKHPLQNKWTLWYYKNDRTKNWEDNQKEVITFSTVEDFWALYNHIEFASNLLTGCDYSLFKEGIKPMWEDPQNAKGGKWLLTSDKKMRNQRLDNNWLEIMMCLIGEAFGENGVIVNGAVVNIRGKNDKIAVWLADSYDTNSIMAVGQCIKNRLNLEERELNFEVHEDTMKKNCSSVRAKFFI